MRVKIISPISIYKVKSKVKGLTTFHRVGLAYAKLSQSILKNWFIEQLSRFYILIYSRNQLWLGNG